MTAKIQSRRTISMARDLFNLAQAQAERDGQSLSHWIAGLVRVQLKLDGVELPAQQFQSLERAQKAKAKRHDVKPFVRREAVQPKDHLAEMLFSPPVDRRATIADAAARRKAPMVCGRCKAERGHFVPNGAGWLCTGCEPMRRTA